VNLRTRTLTHRCATLSYKSDRITCNKRFTSTESGFDFSLPKRPEALVSTSKALRVTISVIKNSEVVFISSRLHNVS
tara:strand:- start:113 stop:343 length:231 start_codon:yes stop_codon:yes gene_type:complete